MSTYTITTANWNDPSFWSSISETGSGHSFDFSGLTASYTVSFDPASGLLQIDDGSSAFTVGDADYGGGTDATLGGVTLFEFFDTLRGSLGDDDLKGGADADTFLFENGFGNDTVSGGESVTTGTDNDTLDLSAVTDPVNVTYTGPEAGTITDGSDTITFSGIEKVVLGSGDDSVDSTDVNANQDGDHVGINIDTGGGNDTINSGRGGDTIDGGDDDDIIDGGRGDDSLMGGDGSDTIYGGTTGIGGNDTIHGGAGDDSIDGGSEADTLSGGTGADTIYGGSDADLILLEDGFGSDQIIGGEDVTFGSDDDTIDGSALTDGVTVTYSGKEDGTISDGADTAIFSEVENVFVGSGDDVLDGSALNAGMTLSGNDGDDTLIGGSGNDTFEGGSGSDTFVIDHQSGYDTITGGDEGGDTDRIDFSDGTVGGVTVSFNGNETGNYQVSGSGTSGDFSQIERVSGSENADSIDASASATGQALDGDGGNDTIVGSTSADTITGGDGDDQISDGEGDDYVDAGDGNDTIGGWTGNDTFFGGAGDDRIEAGDGEDSIEGGSGDDLLVGYDAAGLFSGNTAVAADDGAQDTISGGTGSDTIAGGRGADSLSGGDDADTFILSDDFGNDTIVGGEGATSGTDFDTLDLSNLSGPVTVTFTGDGEGTVTDGSAVIAFSEIEKLILTDHADSVDASADTSGIEIVGGSGNDTIIGGSGDDTISGDDGDDDIRAGAGADTLTGGDGSDTLAGEEGDDLLSTGAGDDTIALADNSGADTVTDFDTDDTDQDGQFNDQLDVSDVTNGSGNPINVGNVTTTDQGGDAELGVPSGASLRLQSTPTSELDETSEYRAAGVPCFTTGTMIQTPQGEVPVEHLRPGDLVLTRDNGPQPILWSAMHRFEAKALKGNVHLKPIEIAPGAFGNDRALIVSPQHGLLLRIDGEERLVRANHLATLGGGSVRVKLGCRRVTYCHLFFEHHQILFSNGVPSESFFPGPQAIGGVESAAMSRLCSVFPDVRGISDQSTAIDLYGTPARGYSRKAGLPDHLRAIRPAP